MVVTYVDNDKYFKKFADKMLEDYDEDNGVTETYVEQKRMKSKNEKDANEKRSVRDTLKLMAARNLKKWK